jgi:hypothetical protein
MKCEAVLTRGRKESRELASIAERSSSTNTTTTSDVT